VQLRAVTGAFLVLLAGANLATPLYAVYRERFGFSSAVLTLVFATYALVLAPSLLVFGQLSDPSAGVSSCSAVWLSRSPGSCSSRSRAGPRGCSRPVLRRVLPSEP
jgi:hypothetical protein